jgi:hypothetical protein
VTHALKSIGGGPPGLRQVLAREGVTDPLWYRVPKSRKASKYPRRTTAEGPDLRTLGRVAVSGAERSPFVEMTAGKAFRIRIDRKLAARAGGSMARWATGTASRAAGPSRSSSSPSANGCASATTATTSPTRQHVTRLTPLSQFCTTRTRVGAAESSCSAHNFRVRGLGREELRAVTAEPDHRLAG